MISQPLFRVGDIHIFTGLFEKRRRHHAESILTVPSGKRPSIVNSVQGYSQVYRISDTRRKRYGFMCSSA
jgi:hypothetical protein